MLCNRGKCINIGSMESINIRMVVLHDSVQENLFDHSLSFLFDVDCRKGQFLRVQILLKLKYVILVSILQKSLDFFCTCLIKWQLTTVVLDFDRNSVLK